MAELEKRTDLSVEITATHIESINGQDEIHVLFELQKDGSPKALYWGTPVKLACIPNNIVEKFGIKDDSSDLESFAESKCGVVNKK